LELLKEILPKLSRVGILWNIDARDIGFGRGFKEYQAAAQSLHIPLESLPIRASNIDFVAAFNVGAQARVNGVITLSHIAQNTPVQAVTCFRAKLRVRHIISRSKWTLHPFHRTVFTAHMDITTDGAGLQECLTHHQLISPTQASGPLSSLRWM